MILAKVDALNTTDNNILKNSILSIKKFDYIKNSTNKFDKFDYQFL